MLFKNIAGQKIHVYAYDSTTGEPEAGDAANITAYISLDGTANAIDDTNPAEVDSTNMPGIYVFDLAQAETNCDSFALYAKSATANIRIEPIIGFTNYGAIPHAAADAAGGLPISDAGGLDLDSIAGEGDTGITLAKMKEMLAAFLAGKVSRSSVGGVTTLTYKKRDGTTTSFTAVCDEDDGDRVTTGSLS